MFQKTLLFLFAFLLASSVVVSAGSQSSWFKNSTVLSRGIDRLFERFDADKDGSITEDDMEKFWQQVQQDSLTSKYQQRAKETFDRYLSELDLTVQDGKISKEEFQRGLYSIFPSSQEDKFKNVTAGWKQWWQSLTGSNPNGANLTLCQLVKGARGTCPVDPRGFEKVKIKVMDVVCRSGVSSLVGYPLEMCVLNAQGCEGVAKCYGMDLTLSTDDSDKDDNKDGEQDKDDDDGDEISVSLKKRSALIKREDANGWRLFYWTSLILAGVVMVPTIVLIPFYVVLVIVSLSAIDFSKV